MCHNVDKNGSPRSPQIFIFSFLWHKYYFQKSFIRLVAVKLQFTKHEVVILEIMVPYIFWFFKKYPYRYFCPDMDENGMSRTSQTFFCSLMGWISFLASFFHVNVSKIAILNTYKCQIGTNGPSRISFLINLYIGIFAMIFTKIAFQEITSQNIFFAFWWC